MKFINSKRTLFLIIAILTGFVFYGPVPNILTWDLFGHYIYLPLVFDQHTLVMTDLSYPEQINAAYQVSPSLYQFVESDSGTFFTKYTTGWAILQSPFYLIAECWAFIAGEKTDGFSYPYQFMIYFGSWFYAVLGLIFTRKILLHFFKDSLVSVLLVLVVFGTNLFFMFFNSVGQSNLFAFFLVALLFYMTIRFYENPSVKKAIGLGFVWGLLVLVRPPDGIFGILIFLWNVNSWQDFKTRFFWFISEKRKLTLILISVFGLTLLPQMLYWFSATGSFIINSYSNNNGEGFDFADPYLFEFLFSFRKGWLLYTPLMLFAFFGAIVMIRKNSGGKFMTLVSLLFLYIIASWTCWWYGAGLSSRAAIDMYAFCIVFIGFTFMQISGKGIRVIVASLCIFFVGLNLIQTYQITQGILNHSFMTKEYYMSTFLQLEPPSKEQLKLLSFDREQAHRDGFLKNEKNYIRSFGFAENFTNPQVLNKDHEYAEEYFLPTQKHIRKSHCWIKVSWFYNGPLNSLDKTVFYISALYKNARYGYQSYTIHDPSVHIDTLNHVIKMMYLTPNIRTKNDRLNFGASNNSEITCSLTARRIELFEPIVDYK